MRRPSTAREALRFSPLMQAGRAYSTPVERVPLEAAGAKPFVLLTGRPTAERATDAWRLRFAGSLYFLKLAVGNCDRFVGDRTHGCSNRTAQPARRVFWISVRVSVVQIRSSIVS
jgi:hypothetical protein